MIPRTDLMAHVIHHFFTSLLTTLITITLASHYPVIYNILLNVYCDISKETKAVRQIALLIQQDTMKHSM